MAPRVTLLTREGCHLCVDAQEVATSICGSLGLRLDVRDVDSDPALAADYSDHVPVVLINEIVHSYWFVDADQLRAALSQATGDREGDADEF